MIGIAKKQVRLYEIALAHVVMFKAPPTIPYCRAALGISSHNFSYACDRLVLRGFATIEDGRIVPHEPPHQRIIRDVCFKYGVTIEEIRGQYKGSRLVVARRSIASQLLRQRYSMTAVALLINRYRGTIEEYFKPERTQRRARILAQQRAERRNEYWEAA